VKAIIKTGSEFNNEMNILKAVERVNEEQKLVLFHKIKDFYELHNESFRDKKIAVWGLAFKPETDDMREAPAQIIIRSLVKEGAHIHAHDPEAMNNAKILFADINAQITYFEDNYEALKGADALLLLTEWNQYRQPDFELVKKYLKHPVIFDGRNQYNPAEMKEKGFRFFCIGRKH
jgi:UDPglucose 6-dehydrogenase